MQVVSVGRQRLSAKFQVLFRLIMGLISLVFLSVFLPLIPFPHLTLRNIIVCILAFIPTGWGLLLVSKPSYYLPCFLLFTLFWSSPYLFYKYLFLFFFLLCFNVFLFSICWCFVWFIRLHKLVNHWLNELDIGDQWGHLLVAMKEWWACFCSPQLHSWLGYHLFQNSKHECSSNRHSAEVYRFPVFLVESWRIAPPAIKSKCIPSNSFTNLNISSMFHPIISSGETI